MGCDKTTPSLVMGASSVDLPTIGVSGGPMLNGKWRGQELGSGTGVWSMSEQVRAGTLKLQDFFDAESCMHRSHGHCMTMGTASTMASMVEALGLGLPGNAAYPAVDGRRNVLARMAGRRIVDMVHEDQRISTVLTRRAFENAIVTLAAIGGSTNAVIHLIAIAGRLGVKLAIDDFDRLASELPCLVNLQPSGKHLMEDFCYAGGLPVVMKEIARLLHLDVVTANGKTLGENIESAENFNTEVIKPFSAPFKDKAGIAVLRGNLAPRGAIIKPSAATPALMVHRGRAVVFDTIEEFHARIDDESLDIDETCVMVLRNCGPKGYPGMAEVGNMPLPPKVLRKGITDMVRISDARMSGTAYGTVVLHTAPEAADGGPLAAVRTGDFIELDVPRRRVHLDISDAELAARMSGWQRPAPPLGSGYWKLYVDTVLQADQGADLSFLAGKRGSFVPRPDEPEPEGATTSSARSCRATTIDALRSRVRGVARRSTLDPAFAGWRGDRRQQGRKRPTACAGVFRSRADAGHRIICRHSTDGDKDDLEIQDPRFTHRGIGDHFGVRRCRDICRRSRRSAVAAPRGRSGRARGLSLVSRLLGLARSSPRLGQRPLGARPSRLRLPRAEVASERRPMAPESRKVGARRSRPRRRAERRRRPSRQPASPVAPCRSRAQKPEPGCSR